MYDMCYIHDYLKKYVVCHLIHNFCCQLEHYITLIKKNVLELNFMGKTLYRLEYVEFS